MKADTSKTTILVISMGFLIPGILFSLKWALLVSLTIGIIGIISNSLTRKIEWAWMKLGQLLNYIIPSVLLGLVFYLILWPVSIISRFFTKDPLMLLDKHETFFITVNKEFEKKSFEKTW